MKYISVLWAIGCLLFSSVLCADAAAVEYKIKAGYLYNFTKFITWTEDNTETFNLCIAGDDPFGELIDPIEQRSVMGRPIKLLRFDSLASIEKNTHCHILYVSAANKEPLAGRSFDNTLIVGESTDFIMSGGMIGFINNQGKIKLQINLKTVKQGDLKISAKLLEVAVVVNGDNHD